MAKVKRKHRAIKRIRGVVKKVDPRGGSTAKKVIVYGGGALIALYILNRVGKGLGGALGDTLGGGLTGLGEGLGSGLGGGLAGLGGGLGGGLVNVIKGAAEGVGNIIYIPAKAGGQAWANSAYSVATGRGSLMDKLWATTPPGMLMTGVAQYARYKMQPGAVPTSSGYHTASELTYIDKKYHARAANIVSTGGGMNPGGGYVSMWPDEVAYALAVQEGKPVNNWNWAPGTQHSPAFLAAFPGVGVN